MFPINNTGLQQVDLSGGIGGMFAGEQQMNINEAQQLANLFQSYQNQIAQKDAAFAQDDMNNPELRDWRMRGMIGKDKTSSATGDYDQAVLGDKIKSGIQAMKTKMSEDQFKQQITEMEKLHTFLQTVIPDLEEAQPGLDMNLRIMQAATESGLDPQIASRLISGKSGGNIEQLKKLKAAFSYALTQDTKHRQSMEGKELDLQKELEGRRVSGEYNLEAARINATGRQKDAESLANARRLAFMKLPPQTKYVEAMGAIEAGVSPITGDPLTEQERTWLTQQANSAKAIVDQNNAARAAGNINAGAVTGLPTNPMPNLPAPGGQHPGQQQSGSITNIGGLAKQAFGSYEPDKYDYRVGPNGNLQRKKK